MLFRQLFEPGASAYTYLLACEQTGRAALIDPVLEAVERDYILTVLRQTHWVITGPRGAATLLDLHPSTLRNRMKKLGISRSSRHIGSGAPPVVTSAPPATIAPPAVPSPLEDGSRS